MLFNGSAADLPPGRSDGCLGDRTLRADCTSVEDTSRMRERGWMVLRGLMPAEEAAALASSVPIESQCTPQIEDCHLTRAQMVQRLPQFVARVDTTFAEWERSGLAAQAGLGSGMRLAETGTARPIWVTTDATFGTLVGADVDAAEARARTRKRYESGRLPGNWHVDSSGGDGYEGHTHRMWVLLHKRADRGGSAAYARAHANLCVVSTGAVDACDSPLFRNAVARGESSSQDVFAHLSCCPHLDVGDAVFYREDVIHGTQDKLVNRLGMSITIAGDGPPRREERSPPEDARCATWAAAGYCSAAPARTSDGGKSEAPVDDARHTVELMQCLCARSCEAVASKVKVEL